MCLFNFIIVSFLILDTILEQKLHTRMNMMKNNKTNEMMYEMKYVDNKSESFVPEK